jgi:hypothetical protein
LANSDLKTKPTAQSVEGFLAAVPEERRADCATLLALLRRVTGEEPRMWGPSMVEELVRRSVAEVARRYPAS